MKSFTFFDSSINSLRSSWNFSKCSMILSGSSSRVVTRDGAGGMDDADDSGVTDVWGDFFKNLLTPELKREASRENAFLLDLGAVASDCGALGTGLGSARKASVAVALGGCPVASFFSLFSSSCSPALLLLMRWWLVWAISCVTYDRSPLAPSLL